MQFRQSRSGRHATLALLIGALALWLFALWVFGATLNLSLKQLSSSIGDMLAQRPGLAQAVPALLTLVLIIATPLLIWNILVEWAARYEVTETGLRFCSLGVHLSLPWEDISAVRVEVAGNEPPAQALTTSDPLAQLNSRLLRALYQQAFGRSRLPIYSGIEDRQRLIAEIQHRAGTYTAIQ